MITQNPTKKGKAIEYSLISKLLANDFDIYKPVTDVEGVDMIIKNKEGFYIEIQVKSRTIKEERNEFKIKDFKPRQNFFVICHNINKDEFFVLPSYVYDREAKTKMEKGKKMRILAYYSLRKYPYYKNEKGIEFLKDKALANPNNQIADYKD